jgi:hypothetical protein
MRNYFVLFDGVYLLAVTVKHNGWLRVTNESGCQTTLNPLQAKRLGIPVYIERY